MQTTGPFMIPPQQFQGMTYKPVMTQLEITLNDAVRAIGRGVCDMGWGITMQYTISTVMPVVWDPGSNGLQIVKDPSPQHGYALSYDGIGSQIIEWLFGWMVDAFAGGLFQGMVGALSAILPYGEPLPVTLGPTMPFKPSGGKLDGALILEGTF